ncbi:septum site-determining protein MinC [Gracilibacillus sp. JCM 18860]|uniref:septum site-determining protein MinC n=1 Tax=Gracilibacillus sp. JCM 18860 TaxID=1306159 RepID=UPI000A7DAF4C
MAANRYITIKGTRDGLTLFMNDQCAFDDLLQELENIISTKHLVEDEQSIRIKIKLGNRYLDDQQEEKLRELIDKQNTFIIEQIESDVILKETALQWKEETEIELHNKIVRSGQILKVTGDLLLVGDVNPGGKVMASGNIFIVGGHLRGIAHAGVHGNDKAVIAASYMAPSQLRIADIISRPPDQEKDGVHMECGFIDSTGKQIIMDRINVLAKNRFDLNAFERRIING